MPGAANDGDGAGAAAAVVVPRDLAALPKCELHVHLEGAMRRETLVELCGKHGVAVPEDPRGKKYDDFMAFAACYCAACECLRDRDDVFRMVREFAEDARAAGCVWSEVAPSLELWADRFGGVEKTLLLLLEAAAAAEADCGGETALAYIIAAERHEPPAGAEALATVVAKVVTSGQHVINGRPGIVGFGLHSAECGFPPQPFATAFAIAREAGLACIPHAGELPPGKGVTGADSVAYCVNDLGATRILHGVLCHTDPALVQKIKQDNVCLDMCPSSNVLLGVVPTIQDHPLPTLLRQGVAVTINSDDPLLFGPRLLDEFETCRNSLGLTDDELALAARHSFVHSHASKDIKDRGIAAIDAWLTPRG